MTIITPTDLDTSLPASTRPRRTWKRGMGAVRQRAGAWYLRYSANGRRHEEQIPARTKAEAQAFLRNRLKEVDDGAFRSDALTVRVRDFYQLIRDDYFVKGQRVDDLPKRWNHLEPVFGSRKTREVTEGAIVKYSADRLKAGAAPSSVQKELACLRRMYRLGKQHKLISVVPVFPQVEESGLNARQGILEDDDFQRVCAALPEHLRVLTTVAYLTGARKGELLTLQWRHVNLHTGKVTLEAKS